MTFRSSYAQRLYDTLFPKQALARAIRERTLHSGGYVGVEDVRPVLGQESYLEAIDRMVKPRDIRVAPRRPTEHNPGLFAPYGEPQDFVPDPMKQQVGGEHYRNLPIQPFEFTLTNGWDGAAHTILKYVHRHSAKGRALDLQKALHTVDIRAKFLPPLDSPRRSSAIPRPYRMPTTMARYIAANQIDVAEAVCLRALEHWVENPISDSRPMYEGKLRESIRALLEYRYPMGPLT